ncbi:MAG: M20 family metallopeptidase [Chloroflexi bacterium]|nr:M20 family metallopeptidase [Chloroflexota bacterium]
MPTLRDIYTHLQNEQGALMHTLRRLVEHETPTDNKAAIDRAQEFLAGEFDALEAQVAVLPQAEAGNQLRVTFNAQAAGPQLTILTHIDTVYPLGTLAEMPYHEDGQLAYGPGIFDMKGGIVIALYALKALRDLAAPLARRVVFVVTSDEETGSHTSRALIEDEARRSDTVLVLEPGVGPHGAIKTWRKGIGGFRLAIKGRAAHAGADPDKGRSAIVEMSHQVLRIHALNNPAKGTSVNVGVLNAGTRSNVVPAEAVAQIDVRVMTTAEWDRIAQTMNGLSPVTPDTTLAVSGALNRPPMERTPAILSRYAVAKELAAQIGYALDETGTGGGSDGNFTAALGIPTLDGLGAVGNGAHSPSEFVTMPALPKRAALIAGLLRTL